MIAQILKDDCNEVCRDANEYLKNGLIKRALDKYEESFVIFYHYQATLPSAWSRALWNGWMSLSDAKMAWSCWSYRNSIVDVLRWKIYLVKIENSLWNLQRWTNKSGNDQKTEKLNWNPHWDSKQ